MIKAKYKITGKLFYLALIILYLNELNHHFSYMPRPLWVQFKWTITAAIWNIGALVLSLDWGQKRKILATICYIPTLIVSPMLCYWFGEQFIWIVYLIFLMILVLFLMEKRMRYPPTFRNELKLEVYKLIDKYFRKLPKNSDGSFNEFSQELIDNDIDALRHAYVSGVFVWEYGEDATEIFGRLNEKFPGGGISSSNSENSVNMDLWNNSIGRKYGKKSKTKKELFNKLLKALKNDELIVNPDLDKRQYSGSLEIKENIINSVIVLKENKKGKNQIFFDFIKSLILKKSEFISMIKNGEYPNYEIRKIGRDEIPVSKKDTIALNNLG